MQHDRPRPFHPIPTLYYPCFLILSLPPYHLPRDDDDSKRVASLWIWRVFFLFLLEDCQLIDVIAKETWLLDTGADNLRRHSGRRAQVYLYRATARGELNFDIFWVRVTFLHNICFVSYASVSLWSPWHDIISLFAFSLVCLLTGRITSHWEVC